MNLLFTLLMSLTMLACTKSGNTVQNSSDPLTTYNVSYGSDARQKMDLFLPSNRTAGTTPSIVLIHGGAWNGGDKSDFKAVVDTLKLRFPDYAIFNINYRLFNPGVNPFPTQEDDVKAAIDHIIQHSSEYRISSSIILFGASAGAHLAALHAYKQGNIKLVVDFFGPTDMVDLYNNPSSPYIPFALNSLLNGTPETNKNLYFQSSPFNFVTTQSPPTIILHGGRDELVNPKQSERLYHQLQAKGVTSKYLFYPNEGHGWYGLTLTESMNEVAGFIKSNMH